MPIMQMQKLIAMLPGMPPPPGPMTTGCSPSGSSRVAKNVIGTSMKAMMANTAA